MVSVRFSGMFNMVQEFGTAVYRIVYDCYRYAGAGLGPGLRV